MRETQIQINGRQVPMTRVHTLVIGSGAAGLNAAVQLHNQGVDDLLIITEGLNKGTSINTGSDKQTYYKLSLCGDDADAPRLMANNYFAGGSMHGDLALVEASQSARAFLNLANLGVPFPQDPFGQFVGYKTDHDPRQRATSIGPYTSREMCRALIREVHRKGITVNEDRDVCQLLVTGEGDERRACGAIAVDGEGRFEAYGAENVIFAVGGPGGLYAASVYPPVHTGAIGLALMAGADAQSLPESQYGLASIQFRWNVSGTFMQVIPKFVSTNAEGTDEPVEFMREYFDSVGRMNSMVFLKGYQWPFDPRKIIGGSSIVDILVYIETVVKGRRVYLDFRDNPEGFRFEDLQSEALEYLTNSQATFGRPIERLTKMNPKAIELYLDHDIDIRKSPLEIAVCAQHNNGGLAGNHWWESLNIRHLFPIGEVNGSHGVYRPGGSALNSGQVAAFRVADYIANCYRKPTLDDAVVAAAAEQALSEVDQYVKVSADASRSWQDERLALQQRMSRAGAHIRSADALKTAVAEAAEQWHRLNTRGCGYQCESELAQVLKNRQLCYAHLVYLNAIRFAVESGVGSRGSAVVLDPAGEKAHPKLDADWCFAPEDKAYIDKVLLTRCDGAQITSQWIDRRPIPESDLWFETAWAAYREKQIFQ